MAALTNSTAIFDDVTNEVSTSFRHYESSIVSDNDDKVGGMSHRKPPNFPSFHPSYHEGFLRDHSGIYENHQREVNEEIRAKPSIAPTKQTLLSFQQLQSYPRQPHPSTPPPPPPRHIHHNYHQKLQQQRSLERIIRENELFAKRPENSKILSQSSRETPVFIPSKSHCRPVIVECGGMTYDGTYGPELYKTDGRIYTVDGLGDVQSFLPQKINLPASKIHCAGDHYQEDHNVNQLNTVVNSSTLPASTKSSKKAKNVNFTVNAKFPRPRRASYHCDKPPGKDLNNSFASSEARNLCEKCTVVDESSLRKNNDANHHYHHHHHRAINHSNNINNITISNTSYNDNNHEDYPYGYLPTTNNMDLHSCNGCLKCKQATKRATTACIHNQQPSSGLTATSTTVLDVGSTSCPHHSITPLPVCSRDILSAQANSLPCMKIRDRDHRLEHPGDANKIGALRCHADDHVTPVPQVDLASDTQLKKHVIFLVVLSAVVTVAVVVAVMVVTKALPLDYFM